VGTVDLRREKITRIDTCLKEEFRVVETFNPQSSISPEKVGGWRSSRAKLIIWEAGAPLKN